jgi:hypothetical protein
MFFALFFASLCIVVARNPLNPWVVITVVAIGAFDNILFQAAAYPHYEIAMTAVTALAIAAGVSGYSRLFVLCLVWLPFIREDGGFYAAFAYLACSTIDPHQNPRTLNTVLKVVAGVAAAALALLIKASFFPGFDAFSGNFAGHHWDHVAAPFLAERLQSVISTPNTAIVLGGSVALALFDVRYAAGAVLLSPLFMLYILSVRPEHGHFTLYFAFPFLLPCVMWLAVYVRRKPTGPETALLTALAIAATAPFQFALGSKTQFWYVPEWALRLPIADIRGMQEYSLWARKSLPGRNCVSVGVAALIPNNVPAEEVLAGPADVTGCQSVLLMLGDMQYGTLRPAADAAFHRLGGKSNVELWFR